MASFNYLWKNRIKFKFFSVMFFKVWMKRLLLLKPIIYRNRVRKKLISYGADIHETAEIGKIICNGNPKNIKIGSFTFIGSSVELASHTHIVVGDKVCINDGVKLLSASHDLEDPKWNHKKKAIIIDDYAWIATNAIILPGVHIGKGAVIGAGAVVSRNVEPFSIVIGNPCYPIDKKRVQDLDYNPCEFLAANRAWLKG